MGHLGHLYELLRRIDNQSRRRAQAKAKAKAQAKAAL
jgi:hypothetical protein